MSDEDIVPSELDSQLQEFIDQAKAPLCGEEYFEVSDIYDNLVLAFDEVLRVTLSSGKRVGGNYFFVSL